MPLFQAYQLAETMRAPLLEQRQRMQSSDNNDQADCEKHIVAVKNKALFLLKFAGKKKDADFKKKDG